MIINQSIMYLVIKVVNACLALYSTFYLTSVLDPNEYGRYSQVISLVLLVGGVFYLPVTASITRYYQQKENKDEFLNSIILLYVFSSICVLSITIIVWNLFESNIQFITFIPLLMIKGLHDVSLEINRAKLKPIIYGMQTILQLITFIAILKSYQNELDFQNSLYISIASFMITCCLFVRFPFFKFKTNQAYIVECFNYGRTLIPVYFLGFFFQLVDRQIIALTLPSEFLAYYQVIFMLAQSILLLVITSISLGCYPLLVKSYKSEYFDETNKQVFYIIFGLSVPALFGYIAISGDVIKLFFGDLYYNHVKDFIWVVPVSVFNIALAANYFDFAYKLTNNNIKQVKVYILPLIIVILGNVIFLPDFGIKASAMSFFIGTAIMLVTTIIESRKYIKLYIDLMYIFAVCVVSICMFFIIELINTENLYLSISIKVTVGVMVFLLLFGRYSLGKINGK